MRTAYLGLGSNIDAEENIRSGIRALQKEFAVTAFSPIYRVPAEGFDGDDFINLAACIETTFSPLDLKRWLHTLEDRHERQRDVPRYSSRTLDIDILLYDDLWLISPELEIPRDEILGSAHVLKPLADLAPDLIHPVENLPILEIWENFNGAPPSLKEITL